MKKLLLLFTLIVNLNVSGQNYKDEIIFYGVDYSQVKVYGVTESYNHFRDAFLGINRLFVTEPKKYDVGKILKANIYSMDLEPVADKIKSNDTEDFHTVNRNYKLTDEDIQEAINNLLLEEENGTGLVILAQLLNKPDNRGTYIIVYFDISTREIIDTVHTSGKPKGFGLRNYWAYSMLQALKKS